MGASSRRRRLISGNALAVISHRFWQSRFGGSFDAIGTTIHIDGAPSRIIGILPADFRFSDEDVWEPHTMYPNWDVLRGARGDGFWAVLGRLRPNVTIEQAGAEMNAIARRFDELLPLAQRNRSISVVPLSLQMIGPRPRLALWMLAGAVFLVLLIAATNVASLSLARSASREREIAIRAALGASRARIVRQLLAESLTLAVTAGLLGLLVAYASIRFILAVKPGNLARLNEVSLDPYVLGCALALCLLTGILVGLTPAITMARRDLRPSCQEGGRGIAGGAATVRTRRALVVTEFALAIVLLVGAGLLVRSLWSVQNVDLGFRPERVLSVSLAPPASTAPAQRTGFYKRVLDQVGSVPGVESAGITSELFLSGSAAQVVTVEGEAQAVSPSADSYAVTSSARDYSGLSGLLCSRAASFQTRMAPPFRRWRSSMMRWRARCGLGAIRWARGSSSEPRIPSIRGSRLSESWATCAARDWRRNRSRRCSSRWRKILPGARFSLSERPWLTRFRSRVSVQDCSASRGKICTGLWSVDTGKPARRFSHRASLPDLASDRVLRRRAADGRYRDLRPHPVLDRDAHA